MSIASRRAATKAKLLTGKPDLDAVIDDGDDFSDTADFEESTTRSSTVKAGRSLKARRNSVLGPTTKQKARLKFDHLGIPFTQGTTHGNLFLIKKLRPLPNVSANLKRRWLVRCTACNSGEEIEIPEHYMKRQPNPKTHCGCLYKSSRTDFNQEYRIWLMMHERCFNPKHMAFHNYGGRGIQVCMEWRRSKYGGPYKDVGDGDDLLAFEAFLKEIGPRPSKLYSVDRIDNYKGYEPGNVKWSTDAEQAANRR